MKRLSIILSIFAVASCARTTQPPGPRCGNGVLEPGEQCDDGNTLDGDGCNPDCTLPCTADADCADGNACNGDETCNTATHTCEAGVWLEDGTVCLETPRSICLSGECSESRCGDGYVDMGSGESCEPPGVGGCDADCHLACTSDADCPDDLNPCNGTEYCNTSAGTCDHRDRPPSGTVCRASAGDCDEQETCDGTGADCPADALATSGTVCRAAADLCDAEETCDGSSAACPADAFATSGTVCRAAADLCDVEETCDGSSAACPTDMLETSGTVCRTAADLCDAEETCDGSSAACPSDALATSGTVCRTAAGDCDVEETCDGSSAACPSDEYHPSTYVCRPALASCDSEERCTGTSVDCPTDVTSCTHFRRPITVDNTASSSALSDYQVSVTLDTASLVSAGKMRTDCANVRFFDSDATTALPYWIESGCNTSSTLMWTRVPSIPASSTKTIYVYYGDSGWTSESSIPDTFLAGSDWEADDGFTFVESGAAESFGNTTGALRSGSDMLSFVSLVRTADTYVYEALPAAMTDGYAIRALERVTVEPTSTSRFVQPISISQTATDALTTASQYALEIVWDSHKGWNLVEDRGSSYGFATFVAATVGTWYVVEATKSGSTASLQVWTSTYTSAGSTTLSLTMPTQSRTTFHPYLKRSSTWASDSFTGDQDWSLVRRYSSPEPTTGVGAEETP